jgi:hypothetical protein
MLVELIITPVVAVAVHRKLEIMQQAASAAAVKAVRVRQAVAHRITTHPELLTQVVVAVAVLLVLLPLRVQQAGLVLSLFVT